MKRISLLLTGLFMFYGWVGAQDEKINFNETEHDFGVIGEDDGKASYEFILTNNTEAPLVITNVTASCGCTTPIWTREPIEPKKKGSITAIYNPLGRVGSFTKSITVTTNYSTKPIYLRIKGEVVKGTVAKKPYVPENDYPITIINNYLAKTKNLDFGKTGFKETKTMQLEVYNKSDKPVTQKALKLPKYLKVRFNPDTIPAQSAATIQVDMNVEDANLYGNLSGDLSILINGASTTFTYSAKILDNFDQWTATKKADAGKINVNPTEVNFGKFASGNSRTLRISNSGKSPLTIHTIQSSDPAITISKKSLSINPGEIAELKVSADNKKLKSDTATLSIVSNDPKMPVYDISITAKP